METVSLKRVIMFLALVFLLSFMVSSINATETHLIYNLADRYGLVVEIYSPYQAYPNDKLTVRIRVEAREVLKNVTVSLRIYGSMNKGYYLWPRTLDAVKDENLGVGEVRDQHFNVSIPEDVDPGLLHGLVSCSWKVWLESSWQEQTIEDQLIHIVTYLRNKPYEDLQVAYAQLLANYSSLLGSYDQLRADYTSLHTSYDDLEDSYTYLQANYSALLKNYKELQANYALLQLSFNSSQNDYNNLQTNYDSLNSTYYSLLSNHSSLQASLNELKSRYEFVGEIANSLNLMYVFIETTVIFIATTIYYARSQIYSALQKLKPRLKPKQQA